MLFLYSTGLRIYRIVVWIAAFANPKARLWILGQGQWREDLTTRGFAEQPIWFHCASVGEFEQARPIIEKLRAEDPEQKIALTFFSPSGYEMHKQYDKVDLVTYLPLDTPKNAEAFIQRLNPKIAIFIKYEIWFHFLAAMQHHQIESALVSAHFQEGHILLSRFGRLLGSRMGQFTKIFAQSSSTVERLNAIGLTNVTVNGDTRFDRVNALARESFDDSIINRFCQDSKTLIIGSNWPQDDDFLLPMLKELDWLKAVVVPHELSSKQQDRWSKLLGNQMSLYSDADIDSVVNKRVLLIDKMGILSRVYRYGDVAYVGGGFGKSVHNTLEPAAYGIPVVFGPKNERFDEVQVLKRIGAGFEVSDSRSLVQVISSLFENDSKLNDIKSGLLAFLSEQTGSSQRVYRWIRERIND